MKKKTEKTTKITIKKKPGVNTKSPDFVERFQEYNPPGKPGRKILPIDLDQLASFCEIQASDTEIASMLDMDLVTWLKRKKEPDILAVYNKSRSGGKISLRRSQFKSAVGGFAPEKLLKYLKKIIYIDLKEDITLDTAINVIKDTRLIVETYENEKQAPSPYSQTWLGRQWLGQTDNPVTEEELEKRAAFEWIERAKKYALDNVEYHRSVLLGSSLYWPQIKAIETIEKHIAARTGRTIVIRSARQTMKNECSAMIQLRALEKYSTKGGIVIRTAPTYKPQIVNSKLRLEQFLKTDPLIKENWRRKEGYIYESGLAQVHFLSTDTKASVVGDTASLLLDIDEAHKVDQNKFEEDFGPMTAFHNVPVVMWGVAADKTDLLYKQLVFNKEHFPECNLQFPASVWCELRPEYAEHYNERVKRLGKDHPVILTQYDLVDVDSLGGYFKDHHILSLFNSSHERLKTPKHDESYVVTIDIGGEAEEEQEDFNKKSDDSRDSTVVKIWAINWDDQVNGYPLCLLREIYWWTGKSLSDSPSGLPGQQTIILKILRAWTPTAVIVDGRGVGEQIAGYIDKEYGAEVYKADLNSVSSDCYDTLALINNDRIKIFRDDQSQEYAELTKQAKHTKYEIKHQDKMRIIKPAGGGHIDFIKCMTYLPRVLSKYGKAEVY